MRSASEKKHNIHVQDSYINGLAINIHKIKFKIYDLILLQYLNLRAVKLT